MDYTRLNDETLLQLISRNQELALSELYDRYSKLVYTIAINVVGEQALAEEITQDVFLRLWNKADTYRADLGKVVTWISGITRNRAIDTVRFRRSRAESHSISWEEIIDFDPPGDLNVEASVLLNQQRMRVQQALARLPDDQRHALELAYFQGLSHGQIAEALNEPLGTVKTRVRLAMQKLKYLLQGETT